jgi:hypothetical protein
MFLSHKAWFLVVLAKSAESRSESRFKDTFSVFNFTQGNL